MSNVSGDFKSIENNFVGSFPSSYPFFYTTLGNLQLDIVGFLAVLGEGSVLIYQDSFRHLKLSCDHHDLQTFTQSQEQ
jgi:hypothetical protein